MRKFFIRLTLFSFAVLVSLLLVFFFNSSQETAPFLNPNGQPYKNSIAEIRTVELNGVEQRILIRGQNLDNPILLHLHGGPGGADQAIVRSSGKTVEDIFTVVYWDQRGAGASYSSSTNPASLSLNNIVEDGIVLADKLRGEFGKEKIYLQGHSWGTLVGVHMISKQPSLFHAYIGIGQIANSRQAELLSYNYTKNAAEKAGDKKTLEGLEKIGQPPYDNDQQWIDTAMVERGLMRPYEVPDQPLYLSLREIYQSFVFYPEYSVSDKLNSLNGSKVSFQALWMEAINADLFTTHPRVDVPVYIFQGKYDMHTVTEVAKNYFDELEAPVKQYFSFDNSAHWPHLKEHQRYKKILLGIIGSQ